MTSLHSETPGSRKKAGVRAIPNIIPRVDMTPMVDLGFLLITFFIFTTQLSEPASLDLKMPAEGPPTNIAESQSMTVILTKGYLLYYFGDWDQALSKGKVLKTNLNVKDGLGRIIREKKAMLEMYFGKTTIEEFMLLIKPCNESNYENLIDVLDEVIINDIEKYAIVELSNSEKDYLTKNL